MPTVRLSREECEDDDLPPVCAKCGADGTTPVYRKFVWSPPWVLLFIFLSLPVLLVVYLIVRKKMGVSVPLCGKHVNEWRWPALFGWLSILSTVGLFFVGVAVVGDRETEGLGQVLMMVGGGGFLVCLIALATWNTFIIRPTEITRHDLTLTGVDADFADAVRKRRRESDEYDDRPRRRRKAPARDRYADDADEYDDDRRRG